MEGIDEGRLMQDSKAEALPGCNASGALPVLSSRIQMRAMVNKVSADPRRSSKGFAILGA
jgi:hypothetical protein